MNIERKILLLEKKRKQVSLKHYSAKLEKYLRANSKIANVISKEEIEDIQYKIDSLKLEIEIIDSKIEQLDV